MARYGNHPPLRLAPDPEDPVWRWFIYNGPHGERFTWHSDLGFTPRGIEYLAQFIQQRAEDDEDFPEKARAVALQALQMDQPVMKRTAIQVLCVVGSDEDLELIRLLADHPDAQVAKDAGACLFERGIKLRRRAR